MYLDHVDKLMKQHSCYLLTSVALLFIYHSYSAGYAKPNVAKFNSSILIQFNIYLFNSVRICSIQSLHSFNLIRIDSI